MKLITFDSGEYTTSSHTDNFTLIMTYMIDSLMHEYHTLHKNIKNKVLYLVSMISTNEI